MESRLIFKAEIEDWNDPFNYHCITTIENEADDGEIIAGFISLLDDIDNDERLKELFEIAVREKGALNEVGFRITILNS